MKRRGRESSQRSSEISEHADAAVVNAQMLTKNKIQPGDTESQTPFLDVLLKKPNKLQSLRVDLAGNRRAAFGTPHVKNGVLTDHENY